MTRPRETIEVSEYVDAFRTWAWVDPRNQAEERAVVEAACAHLGGSFDGVAAIERLCEALRAWADEHDAPRVRMMRVQIEHSCLLDRLIYAGEPLRAQRCPIHDGVWSGAFDACPAGCTFDGQLTGWLPVLAGAPPTSEVRAQVLRAYDAIDRMSAHREARAGMFAAITAVRDQPLDADPRVWLWRVLAALAVVRAQFDDPHDDDGWGLGGVATVRTLVEQARASLG